jgi:uncharacterized membrane protein YbhN (UPF0104 family)
MHGAAIPASIATSISIGFSLLAGVFSVWVALRSRKGAAVTRDTAVSILFGIAVLLILLTVVALAIIPVSGMAAVLLLKVGLLLMAAFAVVGAVFGLARGLRCGRAIKTQGA